MGGEGKSFRLEKALFSVRARRITSITIPLN